MNDKILQTIKSLLGVEDDSYDSDLLIMINGIQLTINQITNIDSIMITSDTIWSDWLGDNVLVLVSVQNLVYLKTKMIFDPPNGSMSAAVERQITELEWRITAIEEV